MNKKEILELADRLAKMNNNDCILAANELRKFIKLSDNIIQTFTKFQKSVDEMVNDVKQWDIT